MKTYIWENENLHLRTVKCFLKTWLFNDWSKGTFVLINNSKYTQTCQNLCWCKGGMIVTKSIYFTENDKTFIWSNNKREIQT